jgi:hypothetical protein
MKKYKKPELDVELFDVEDVITASGDTTNADDIGEINTTIDQTDI